MNYPSYEEINNVAKEFLRLKNLAEKTPKNKAAVAKYKKYQNYCALKLEYLIDIKVNKYRKFSNYIDLKQDGFEALMLAFKTYNPSKGDFTWWANKYINTRVSRSANTHSTIRYPLKKSKENQPYKVSKIPEIISNENPLQQVEDINDFELVMQAINNLPSLQKQIILMYHEFDGGKNASINKICNSLSISRNICLQCLEEAKVSLKDQLTPYYQEA